VIGALWYSTSVFAKLRRDKFGAASELHELTWIESVEVCAIRVIDFLELKSARHAGFLL
jgi:hypothetical protein